MCDSSDPAAARATKLGQSWRTDRSVATAVNTKRGIGKVTLHNVLEHPNIIVAEEIQNVGTICTSYRVSTGSNYASSSVGCR
jgi:hypothetical protein